MTKFRFIKETNGRTVNGYNGGVVKTGDIVEHEGHFADKCMANEDYQEIKPRAKKPKSQPKKESVIPEDSEIVEELKQD